jgi:hypothetical protein
VEDGESVHQRGAGVLGLEPAGGRAAPVVVEAVWALGDPLVDVDPSGGVGIDPDVCDVDTLRAPEREQRPPEGVVADAGRETGRMPARAAITHTFATSPP